MFPAQSPDDLQLSSDSPPLRVQGWKVGIVSNEPDDR